jgi:hypothetical protein
MLGDRYYVLWPDGQKFGPADVPTLQRWVVENRVGPATVLENASSGQHVRASDLPSLQTVLPYAGPPGPGSTVFVPSNRSSGTAEVTIAWVLGAIGLLCCGTPAAIGGVVLAAVAMSKRQPNATAALVFNIVVLVLGVIVGAFFSLAMPL